MTKSAINPSNGHPSAQPVSARDLNDLFYFAKVVDEGGFSAAGRALNVSKSHLSRRVAALEARLGLRLLQRSTRRLMLTPAGERYLQYCRLIVQTASDADESMLGLLSEPTGRVTLSTPIGLAQTLLPRILPDFLERYPKVSVNLQITSRVVDLYRDPVDVALRARESVDQDANLIARRFGTAELSLVASQSYLVKHGMPNSPEDLQNHATLSFQVTDPMPQEWRLFDRAGNMASVMHYPRLICGDLQIVVEAVKAGQGIALLPCTLWQLNSTERPLTPVLPDWRAPQGIIYLAYASRRGMIPAVRVLVDYLTEHIGAMLENANTLQANRLVLLDPPAGTQTDLPTELSSSLGQDDLG